MQIAQKYIAMYVHSYKFSKIGLTYMTMYAMMISTKTNPTGTAPAGAIIGPAAGAIVPAAAKAGCDIVRSEKKTENLRGFLL